MSMLPHLPLARYRFGFMATSQVQLPAYTGSAWRGLMGHALKRLVCVTRQRHCPDCLLYRSCVYSYLFETPPDPEAGKLRRYTAAPHPFVLQPDMNSPATLAAGDGLTLEMTMFGHGNRMLAYLVHAMDQGVRRGIGRRRGTLELAQMAQWIDSDWETIHEAGGGLEPRPPRVPDTPVMPGRIRIELLTPLRLRREGANVNQHVLDFPAFFSSLLRRISLLTTFHTDQPLEADFRELTHAAREVRVTASDLHWHDWTRFSARQDRLIQMGGLLGHLELDGPGLAEFWPYLWLGQWTHNGRGTSMGLGRYRVVLS